VPPLLLSPLPLPAPPAGRGQSQHNTGAVLWGSLTPRRAAPRQPGTARSAPTVGPPAPSLGRPHRAAPSAPGRRRPTQQTKPNREKPINTQYGTNGQPWFSPSRLPSYILRPLARRRHGTKTTALALAWPGQTRRPYSGQSPSHTAYTLPAASGQLSTGQPVYPRPPRQLQFQPMQLH
jgi:hypothetical protein